MICKREGLQRFGRQTFDVFDFAIKDNRNA
jgi:hypothetical protein